MQLTWHLGDVVRKLRKARGWNSQRDLATRAGVHLTTIASLEQHGADDSSPEAIRKIAAALGLGEGDLYAYVPKLETSLNDRRTGTRGQELVSSDAAGLAQRVRSQGCSSPTVLRFDRTIRSPRLIVRAVINPDTLAIEDIRIAQSYLLTLKGDHRGKRIDEILPATVMSNVSQHVASARKGQSSTMLYSLRQSGSVVFRQATFEPYRERTLVTVSVVPPPSVLNDLTACCEEQLDCADCVRDRQADGRRDGAGTREGH
jgi:transcriptional regulator with XRE-family HTH domain|tara:strand:- start:2235 stop:3011 length:777 start_codon:yes stop_codon:yes gene_type:complete